MPDMPESFLPRIESVFYAVFDMRQGPKLVYQVPEALIDGSAHFFAFADISTYVVPHRSLCGRLVACSTTRHRIIGYPVELRGPSYPRGQFQYNLGFVFDRDADLSCYKPIVRKVGQVLKSCEEESEFLSSPVTSPAVHAILEQLYEDLNSYSETSIPIDQFNSIELKILPFYPNPPAVKDWIVPLPLINIQKRSEENWDLTVLKVCQHIDGVNHVSRIARLADCDITLTRQAISHLLYYQVIMTIDIFQYSNMYTLRKNIQWLADEPHVKEECGPYVTKKGQHIPDWPKLLHLYSRLKPAKTVHEWMTLYDVEGLGIDVRRFTSFGVVKGFLRRVHRYPVYLPPDPSEPISGQLSNTSETFADPFANSELACRRNKSQTVASLRLSSSLQAVPADNLGQIPFPTLAPESVETAAPPPSTSAVSATHRARRVSAAEKVLEQLRSRDMHKSGSATLSSPRATWLNFQHHQPLPATATTTHTTVAGTTTTTTTSHSTMSGSTTPSAVNAAAGESPTKARPETRRLSLSTPAVPPSSPVLSKSTINLPRRSSRSSSITQPTPQSGLVVGGIAASRQPAIPPTLISLLDGDHHTDELSVRFEAGWPLLEQWLIAIGGGEGDGDYGRVVIIYK